MIQLHTGNLYLSIHIYVKARAETTDLTFTPEQYAKFDEWVKTDFTVFHATVTALLSPAGPGAMCNCRTGSNIHCSHGTHLEKPLPHIRRTPPSPVSSNEPSTRGFAKYNNQGFEFGAYREERLGIRSDCAVTCWRYWHRAKGSMVVEAR
jgi:hypothetical protein